MDGIRLTRIDRNKALVGAGLILMGVLAPLVFTVGNFGVIDTLREGLHDQEKVDVLLAAFLLSLLSALRAFPHYLGAFFVADAFTVERKGKTCGWINVLTVAGLILAVYKIVELVHGIHYDFSGPALILVTLQVLMWKVNYSYIRPLKKVPMMMAFITAFQFLDVMPALDGLPFGRGEVSQDIKLAANVLDCDSLLNGLTALCFVVLLVTGGLMFSVLRDENHVRQISELKEQNERIRMESWIKERESRSTRELQHLVHDLKSPLTVIQTLAGALQYKCSGPDQEQEREYLRRIETSVDHMSNMISEILYEDRKVLLTTQEVLNMILAQISPTDYAEHVCADNRAPGAKVRVNSLRLTRAVINLVENAYHARRDEEIRITLRVDEVEQKGRKMVRICVEDNGKGIPQEELDTVWRRGFSGRGSSGLGLSFVRDVVEQSEGEIGIESKRNRGTKVTILLPKGEAET